MNKFFERIDNWLELRTHRVKFKRLLRVARAVADKVASLHEYSTADLNRESIKLSEKIRQGSPDEGTAMVEALALASVAVKRLLGFVPHETQLAGAILLAEGKVVELRAGEGKTAAAMIAAFWLALNGRHVDIATTNDYLADRDYRSMGVVFGVLGISAGLIVSSTDRKLRRSQYEKDVTYVSNQELGFDYLNDNLVYDPADQVNVRFDAVIIDEADSILIDEARTSLIIAQSDSKKREREFPHIRKFLGIVDALSENADYRVDYRQESVAFTDEGIAKITRMVGEEIFSEDSFSYMRALWYALYASVFLKPDRDYIVRDGKIVLVDAFTGHPLPDRKLLNGLHQAVQAKAGVPETPEDDIIGAITYGNLFKRFRTVAGMTGTAYDAREEFFDLYNLAVVTLPSHHEPQRQDLPTRFFINDADKFESVANIAKKVLERNTPLLIVGTAIATAKKCGTILSERRIPHQLLSADITEREAAVIERAGHPGVITVATNMAGRGADIILDESQRYNYGLEVIGLERNLSFRIDHQLRGRAGRQGQFGRTQFLASLEDELFQVYADAAFWDYAETLAWDSGGLIDARLERETAAAQETAEAFAAESRKWLARFDAVLDEHRATFYEMRGTLLNAAAPIETLFSFARKILFQEELSSVGDEELKRLMRWERLPPSFREILRQGLWGKWNGEAALFKRENPRYAECRQKSLALFDECWKQYLDSVAWLEDWVSLTATGEEDPYRYFIQIADKMFHDMRKDFALKILRQIPLFI